MTPEITDSSQQNQPSDPPIKTCSVLNTTITYAVEGPEDGIPILLVHGVPGSVRDFRYLAPLLVPVCRVYRLELPGFGRNKAALWDDYSPAGRARLLAAFADALQLERFAVLGHSMGGAAALATAANYPKQVCALILVASVGLRRNRGLTPSPRVMRWLRPIILFPLWRHISVAITRRQYARMGFPRSEQPTLRDLQVHSAVAAAMRFEDNQQNAPKVQCPTLVAWAEDDRLIETHISAELAQAISGAIPVAYPNGGHNIQKTQAPHLASQIVDLLSAN